MIPYTTIPFLSALFLVLVGVLIGNLVWSRSRDRQAVLSGQWRERAKRIASNLDDRTLQLQQMEELWGELLQESEELRSRLTATEATAERLQRERDEFELLSGQERETRLNLAASLQDETRRSREWRERAEEAARVEEAARIKEAAAESAVEESVAEAEQLRETVASLQAHVEELQRELTHARGPEREQFMGQLREKEATLRAELAEASTESTSLQEQVETLLSRLGLLELALHEARGPERQALTAAAAEREAELRAQLERSRAESQTLREQLAEVQPQLVQTAALLQEARGPEREALAAKAAEREADLRARLEQALAESQALREQLAEVTPRLARTEQQLQQARGPEQEALVAQARQCEQALRTDLDRARRTAEELMSQLEERDADLAREAASRKNTEQALTKRCEDLRESMLRQIERINGERKLLQQKISDESQLAVDLDRHRQQLAECQRRSTEELERLAARLEQEEEKARELALQLRAETSARKQLQESQQILSRREQVLLDEIVPLRAVAEESKRLRRELTTLQGQHEQLVATRAEELERAEEANAQRLHLEEDLAVARGEVLSLQKKQKQLLAEWEAERGTLTSVRTELQDRESILQRLRDAFRKSQAELSTVTARHASLEAAAQEQLTRLAASDREVEAMRTQLSELRGQLSALGDQLAGRERTEAELRAGLKDARAEVARLAPLEEQLVDRDAVVKSLRDELRDMKRHRDEAQQAVDSMKEIVAELRDELAERLDSFEISESDRATVQREFQLERQRREQLAESCAQWEHDCHLAQEQLADLQDQKTRLRSQLDDWQGRAQRSADHAKELEQQVLDLQARLEQQEELTRQLRGRRLADRPAPVAEPRSGLSFLGLRAKERSQKDQEEMAVRRDGQLGRVYAEPPRRMDDLTRIPGVTRDIQSRLQQLGIYTFQQVMEWDAAIAQEVSGRLGLDGEIERDDWVGNARRLFHERQRLVA